MTAVDTPDWTRSAPTTGAGYQILSWSQTIAINQGFVSPITYAGNWSSLILIIQCLTNVPYQFQVQWYADSAGTQLLYFEPFTFGTVAMTRYQAYTVKAPYFNLKANNGSGGSLQFTATMNGVGNDSAPGSLLVPQVLLGGTNVTVAASSNVIQPMTNSIAGPASMWGYGSTAGEVDLQRWNGSAWEYVTQIQTGAAGGQNVGLVIPPDDCRIILSNSTAGAGSYYYSLVHGG